MIDKALDFVLKELNGFLTTKFESRQDFVALSNIVDQEGSVPDGAKDRLLLTLINTERESAAQSPNFHVRSQDGAYAHVSPSLNLNLYLMISANFDKYDQSLKLLSNAIGYFQGRPVFTAQNAPGFPAELEKLTFEVVNMRLEEMSHLWGALGAKYIPCIIYKVRMLVIQEAWVTDEVPSLKGIDTPATT